MAKRVMTVDDSVSFRKMVSMILADAGFETVEAADGMDALLKLQNGDVDLVLLDVNMPRMDGFELLRRIRLSSRNRFVPVVMLTTDFSEDRKREGREAGATGWIVKPVSPDQLIGVVARLTGKGGG